MKQTWNSETIDSMIQRIDDLESHVKNLIAAGDGLTGCLPSEADWHAATEAWEQAKTKTQPHVELEPKSRTFKQLNELNRRICIAAMAMHDKHYWCLVRYVQHLLDQSGRKKWRSGPEALTHLLGEGYTVASVIWEHYTALYRPARRGP